MSITYKVKWLKQDDAIITLTSHRRKYWLFGKLSKYKNQYRGGCTVWHEFPTGKRAGSMMESYLSDIWTRELWKKEDKQ